MNFVPIIIVLQNKITGPIPEFELNRKLEPELDSCSHPQMNLNSITHL